MFETYSQVNTAADDARKISMNKVEWTAPITETPAIEACKLLDPFEAFDVGKRLHH
jgi:hypothetical protein